MRGTACIRRLMVAKVRTGSDNDWVLLIAAPNPVAIAPGSDPLPTILIPFSFYRHHAVLHRSVKIASRLTDNIAGFSSDDDIWPADLYFYVAAFAGLTFL